MIRCDRISFERQGRAILTDLSFEVATGEHVLLTGRSGVGKSTLLRLIAGFEPPNRGAIRLGDREVAGPGGIAVAPHLRGVGWVGQDLGLWPSMSVRQHLDSVRAGPSVSRPERARRVDEFLAAFGLADLRERRPGALSGGEQQRLALARCLIANPRVLLMDEPFAGLDLSSKQELGALLAASRKRDRITTVTVSHQPWDAFGLGVDRVAVLEDGRILESFLPGDLASRNPVSLIGKLWAMQHREAAPKPE